MLAGLLLAGITSATGCTSGPPPPVSTASYDASILEHRRSKDEMFRADPTNSPMPVEQRSGFRGLSYFSVDPAFRVPATLTEDRSLATSIVVPTSQNKPRRMNRVGVLRFTVAGTSATLGAFVEEGQTLDRLWVPFWDATNRIDTYGGGRYLELSRTATGLYDLDFNLAYNPFCVYNVSYDCPIPPAENRLPIAVRAGERMWP